MHRRKLSLFVMLLAAALRLSAQLSDGSIAPDFTAQDIFGKTHNLYSVLDSGKIVVLEISATWCPPCWAYHTGHALQDFYTEHGPAGDNKARVFWVEGDPNTTANCLYGTSGCVGGSAGNFVAGTPYPILNNSTIATNFQITYFPTIFVICPNRKVYEIPPMSAEKIWEEAQKCPVAAGTNNAGIFNYSPGTELHEICGTQTLAPSFALTNLGAAPLTAASIELKWNNAVVQNLQWTGYLPTYAEAAITFGYQAIAGAGTLKTTITNINNGTGDDDTSNNVHNDNFSAAQQFATNQVLLKIRTDEYGEETYWELRDESGNMLEQGGNQEVGPNGGGAFPLGVPIGPGTYGSLAIIRDTLDLPADGCYSVHFSDAYGDGMCCDFGVGYYKLYNLSNPSTPIITGGEFAAYDRRAFSAGAISATEVAENKVDVQVFPNPASEFLNIEIAAPVSAEIHGAIFNSIGQLQQTLPAQQYALGGNDWRLPLHEWPQGIYFLQIMVGEKAVTRAFAVKRP